jgi:hypothetical protein
MDRYVSGFVRAVGLAKPPTLRFMPRSVISLILPLLGNTVSRNGGGWQLQCRVSDRLFKY